MFDLAGPIKPTPVFETGQRVRIKSMLAMPHTRKLWIGREGIVIGKSIMSGLWFGRVGYLVDVPGAGTTTLQAEQLELVIPSGASPGHWSQSPWQPPKK